MINNYKCPFCNSKFNIKNKCSCGFYIPHYFKIKDKDIKSLLEKRKTRPLYKKSKYGHGYKVVYYLSDNKVKYKAIKGEE